MTCFICLSSDLLISAFSAQTEVTKREYFAPLTFNLLSSDPYLFFIFPKGIREFPFIDVVLTDQLCNIACFKGCRKH